MSGTGEDAGGTLIVTGTGTPAGGDAIDVSLVVDLAACS